ncbi:MAG: type II secretion system protein [Patescibacteria group bacterium]
MERVLHRERGFTLVELLVVIAIIGVLATLLLLQLGGARGKARDTKRIADLTQLRTAVEQYFDDNSGTYPAVSLYDVSDPLKAYIGTGKMANTTDPLDQVQYGYSTAPAISGKILRFQVWAELEVGNPALKTDDDITTTGWTARSTGRMGVLSNGTDPASGTCISNDISTIDCVFDLGVK